MAVERFQVSKNPLQEGDLLSDVAVVDQATNWARRMTQSEARGPGDIENAWRRLEGRYGVPWRTFWSLRYRPPREIAASVYLRLKAAYAAECERQIRRLEHEIQITAVKVGADHPAVVEAKAVARKGRRATAR